MEDDIKTRDDIILLVDTFYGKVMTNNIIGYIFSDVAGIDWSLHLPKMYRFWASHLINEQSYSGNPLRVHVNLSTLTKMTEKEFSEWTNLFLETVDELFSGEKAEEAKMKAEKIASNMLNAIKINEQKRSLLYNPKN